MICGMKPEPGSLEARTRKLFVLCDHLTLTKDDRIDLAKTILHRDITSYKQLTEDQVDRLLDALEGAILIDELRRQKSFPK